jgi:hypothetical protein
MQRRKTRAHPPNPLFAVFCRCGAEWYGHYAVGNPVIADHRKGCGPSITRAEFEALGHRVHLPKWWTDGRPDRRPDESPRS